MLAPGHVVADRFRLIEPLGEGGMGAVWRAEHVHLEIPVALKLMKTDPPPGERMRKRFEREARMAARIQSAHVVRVLDHGYEGDVPFIAMELLPGEDLRARLVARGRLSVAETAVVVRHVARALAKAHEEGLVHRDIKPDNVFIAPDEDGHDIYKVLDFGVVKVTGAIEPSSLATADGALVGTPYYLSPEQAEASDEVDHRSDLWSLGVLAYECLTGGYPFEAESLQGLLVAILQAPVPSVSDARGGPLPAGIDAWMARALAKDPATRFGDAREMAEAFAVAAGVPNTTAPRAVIRPSDRPEAAREPSTEMISADTVAQAATVVTPTTDESVEVPGVPPPRRHLAPVGVLVGVGLVVALAVGVSSRRGEAPAASATSSSSSASSTSMELHPAPAPSLAAPSSAAPSSAAPSSAAPSSAAPSSAAPSSAAPSSVKRPEPAPEPSPPAAAAPLPRQPAEPRPPAEPPPAPPPPGKTPIRRSL